MKNTLLIEIFLLIFITNPFIINCQTDSSVSLSKSEFSGSIIYKYDRVLKTYQCEDLLPPVIDSMRFDYRKGFIQIIEYIKGKISGYTLYNPIVNKIFQNNKTLDSLLCEEGNINESMSSIQYFVDLECKQKILNYQCKCISGNESPKSYITLFYSKDLFINPKSIKSNRVLFSYYFYTTNAPFLKYIYSKNGCEEIYTAIRIEKKEFTIADFELFKLPVSLAAPNKG